MRQYRDEEFLVRQAEFLSGKEFAEFFFPVVKERRDAHIESYLSNGGEEHRIRVRELDDLMDNAKQITTSSKET